MQLSKLGRLLPFPGALRGRRTLQVAARARNWAVLEVGRPFPLSWHDRKVDAVAAARRLADRDGSDVVIFDLGGRPVSSAESATPSPGADAATRRS